ncbi:conserved hypothetical protein [Roseobacter sp. GAI101]|nr:conserved hypothetical protein [Roseobacter sp. GAI101]
MFVAQSDQDVQAAQALRAFAFGLDVAFDRDAFDATQHQVLVRDLQAGEIVCCFRTRLFLGAQLDQSYAAQFYDLTGLSRFDGLMMELGRFCVHPDTHDPDIVRMAWAALTQFVDAQGIKLMFGCSSFAGGAIGDYADCFALLRARHLAPAPWQPGEKVQDPVRFADHAGTQPDVKMAMLRMPPLLRTYLLMGGWVSDHAVVDRHMNTLHVFTGLEIDAIPENRKRLLRGLG